MTGSRISRIALTFIAFAIEARAGAQEPRRGEQPCAIDRSIGVAVGSGNRIDVSVYNGVPWKEYDDQKDDLRRAKEDVKRLRSTVAVLEASGREGAAQVAGARSELDAAKRKAIELRDRLESIVRDLQERVQRQSADLATRDAALRALQRLDFSSAEKVLSFGVEDVLVPRFRAYPGRRVVPCGP